MFLACDTTQALSQYLEREREEERLATCPRSDTSLEVGGEPGSMRSRPCPKLTLALGIIRLNAFPRNRPQRDQPCSSIEVFPPSMLI